MILVHDADNGWRCLDGTIEGYIESLAEVGVTVEIEEDHTFPKARVVEALWREDGVRFDPSADVMHLVEFL